MAKILDEEDQRRALKNITSSIKELDLANEFLRQDNPTGKYIIAFTDENGNKHTAEIIVRNKDDISKLILAHKEEEKKRIVHLAEEKRIDLDPEDYEIMDFNTQSN